MSGTTSGNVTVAIRLRPFLPREKEIAVVEVNGNTVRIQVEIDQIYGAPEVEQRQFVFDLSFPSDTTQEVLYEQVGEPILTNALLGFNGTLFAYGQTGSGKSFSIMGPESNPGIIPRITQRLFEVVDSDQRDDPASEMRTTVSFLEIYNEEIKDLLDPRPKPKKLYVHQHPKLGIYVPHLTEAAALSTAECLRLFSFGAKIRATAQTNMNSTSSRSHSVLTLRITQMFATGKMRNSSVNLCDLAGSERSKKTGAQGKRMREGSSINTSLSVLGQVISKLASGADKRGLHVPFRQSKLTHLLMDALGGNSVTTMLANVSPAKSEAEESLSTLRFAESVKKVKTKPQVMEVVPEEPTLLETIRSDIDALQDLLRNALVSEGDSVAPLAEQMSDTIDASRHLAETISQRSGVQWAQAVEKTKALEAVQRQLLEDMRLPVHEVGQLAGVDSGTPYLLNISDDPALTGCLLYFLRSSPEVLTVGCTDSDSIAPNNLVLRGLGIPARLCDIQYEPDSKRVSICKVSSESDNGRVLVNGRPLPAEQWTELHHTDRIVFGWAFCFRLVFKDGHSNSLEDKGETFESVTKEALEYSLSTTQEGMKTMRAVGHWQQEFSRRKVADADVERLLSEIGGLMVQVEEANALCREVHNTLPMTLDVEMDVGVVFPFIPSSRLPAIVVQVWKRSDDTMLAAWPAATFERRLIGLRDAHREALMKATNCWAMKLSQAEWWAGEAFAYGETYESVPNRDLEDLALPDGNVHGHGHGHGHGYGGTPKNEQEFRRTQ